MNKKEELKKSISTAFNEGNLDFAFERLLTLPHHEVVTLLSKNKWLCDLNIAKFFWGDFCMVRHDYVFKSSSKETILNWYLSDLKKMNEGLNIFLAKNYPDVFIKGIKRNRSFLDENFLQQLILLPWASGYSIDLIAFKELQKTHVVRQENIHSSWKRIEKLSVEVLLSGIIHWIDVRFYQNYSDVNHEQMRLVYDYAVNYLFSKKEIEDPKTEMEFDNIFFNYVRSSKFSGIDSFLNAINHWINFENTVLSSYCFDDNFQATLKDGRLYFEFESRETYEKWQKDSERYLVNSKRYFVDALQIYDYQDVSVELDIPTGGSEFNKNINHALYIRNWQSALFLGDLQLNNLWFKGRSVHCSKFLQGLMSFSVNRQVTYVEPMRQLNFLSGDWKVSLQSVFDSQGENYEKNLPYPFIYNHKNGLVNIYKHAIPELEENEIEDLINHFSYTLKPGEKINPFKIGFSVTETPFIRIGEYLLTPTSFFASNDWFYSIAQRCLSIYANYSNIKEPRLMYLKKESVSTVVQMEVEFAEKFREHGWNSKVILEQEASKLDGDIDIFVNDGKSQLLIQLKRTKFKLDLASDYKDSLETDLKASGQLNEAIKMLESKPMEGMEIMKNHEKWIVTTSFEGVLSTIDGCLKINYFDLIWALRNKKFDSLDELSAYMKSDGPFNDCRHYLELLN